MKKKLIVPSALLITSLLIISIFIWTANAVGNTAHVAEDTNIAIDYTDNLIEVANNADWSTIEDNNTTNDTLNSIDETWSKADGTGITDDDINYSVDNSNNSKEGGNNSFDDFNNSIDLNDSFVDFNNSTDLNDSFVDFNNSTDLNDSFNDFNNSTDLNDSFDDFNNSTDLNDSFDDFNNSTDLNNSFDDFNNSTDLNDSFGDFNDSIGSDNNSFGDFNDPFGTQSINVEVNEPSFTSVCTRNVLFNFSASDELDNNLTYTILINGTEKSSGTLVRDQCKEVGIDLDDGYYIFEIKVKDSLGNEGSSDSTDLYVDTQAPDVTLVFPEDKILDTEGLLNFSFTANDDLTAQYKNLSLNYEIDLDGEPLDGLGSGTMRPGECIQTQNITNLSEGAHDWSVYVEDDAGNNITSDTRTFYIDKKGLKVSLVSPNNELVSTNPKFKFRVSGGTGLPFNYTLLINGEEVKSTSNGGENNTLEVGEDFSNDYSIKAKVADGEDISWTVKVTDVAGNSYQPDPYHFSLDTTSPARVANLSVSDALSDTQWSYTHDSPRLYVNWNANTAVDLASKPYDVFISDSEPGSIEEMEKVKSTSDTSLYIEKYGGKSLVYGKDYWVAVIARDKVGNYNKCFVAVCGPVRIYEDMNITLDPGWNMKSVPKSLLESNSSPESVFGKNSTILYWNGTAWEVPKTIEPCKGYWVYSQEAFENNVKFKPVSSRNRSDDMPLSLNLIPGWQMIGSTSTKPVAWSTILDSLKNSTTDYKFSNLVTYSQIEGWNGIIPGHGPASMIGGNGSVIPGSGNLIIGANRQPVEMLKFNGKLVPGQGYWVYMNKEGTYAPAESISDDQAPSESDIDAEDSPVINSMPDNPVTEEGDINEGDIAGSAGNVPIDNSLTDSTASDDGSIGSGTSDAGSDDNVPIDNSLTDSTASDDGSFDSGTKDAGAADNPSDNGGNTDNGNTDNGNTDNGNTDNGNTDNLNADAIPIGD